MCICWTLSVICECNGLWSGRLQFDFLWQPLKSLVTLLVAPGWKSTNCYRRNSMRSGQVRALKQRSRQYFKSYLLTYKQTLLVRTVVTILTDNVCTPSTAIFQTLSCFIIIASSACLSNRRLGSSVDIVNSVLSPANNAQQTAGI